MSWAWLINALLPFECVRLCSEGKIELLFGDWSMFALLYLL